MHTGGKKVVLIRYVIVKNEIKQERMGKNVGRIFFTYTYIYIYIKAKVIKLHMTLTFYRTRILCVK